MNENFKLDIPKRPRRLRKSASILSLSQENFLNPADFILPVFVIDGRNRTQNVPSMPGVQRLSIDKLLRKCDSLLKKGIAAIAPFPSVDMRLKTPDAAEALNEKSLTNRTIREVKKRFPEMAVIADIALDPYTTHGHDGLLDESGREILNDETVEVLCGMALGAASAGADFVAPSAAMDGRTSAIREALDECGFTKTAIMGYSAKYASCFYSPFRDAVGSSKSAGTPTLDKRSYQINCANSREGLKEALLDEDEGADVLMVKPAGFYLDIIASLRPLTNLPIAAYQVSGEYSMICAAAKLGWLDFEKAKYESLISIKRAGADMILSYFADSLEPNDYFRSQ